MVRKMTAPAMATKQHAAEPGGEREPIDNLHELKKSILAISVGLVIGTWERERREGTEGRKNVVKTRYGEARILETSSKFEWRNFETKRSRSGFPFRHRVSTSDLILISGFGIRVWRRITFRAVPTSCSLHPLLYCSNCVVAGRGGG